MKAHFLLVEPPRVCKRHDLRILDQLALVQPANILFIAADWKHGGLELLVKHRLIGLGCIAGTLTQTLAQHGLRGVAKHSAAARIATRIAHKVAHLAAPRGAQEGGIDNNISERR